MTTSKSQYYLDLSLSKIESYIRGEINLAEALDYLQQLGHKRKSIRKVLISTNRNNVFDFTTKSRK